MQIGNSILDVIAGNRFTADYPKQMKIMIAGGNFVVNVRLNKGVSQYRSGIELSFAESDLSGLFTAEPQEPEQISHRGLIIFVTLAFAQLLVLVCVIHLACYFC